MKATVVIGSGYGDEGKGLMVDYFCDKGDKDKKVLNVRVNGGTQSGHTVCRVDKKGLRYNMYVFKNLGSGSLLNTNTFLASKFIVNCYELNRELEQFNKQYGYKPLVYISENCRVQFKMDEVINRSIEEARLRPHGTCGFGIFETVNRHHDGLELRMRDVFNLYSHGMKQELQERILNLSKEYLRCRMNYLKKASNLNIDEATRKLLESANDLAFKTTEDIWKLLDNNKGIIIRADLDFVICGDEYDSIVFECGQGLELNWGDERNTPHVTASHTGITNVIKELRTCQHRDKIQELEVCYVTRSYKTKHGDGAFLEEDINIKSEYNLYDRTNTPNRFQGVLKYGYIDKKRMSDLINKDFQQLADNKVLSDTCKVTKSLAVTHLDQTNESVLTTDGAVFFKEFNAQSVIQGDKTYYSFGEKAEDIFILE